MSRASALTFVVFLALGLAGALYFGWVVSPVEYVDTAPFSLHQSYKDDYILMIAAVYSGDGDLDAARARLTALGFDDPGPAGAAAAQRLIAAGGPEADLRRIVRLAADFGVTTPEMQPYLPP